MLGGLPVAPFFFLFIKPDVQVCRIRLPTDSREVAPEAGRYPMYEAAVALSTSIEAFLQA